MSHDSPVGRRRFLVLGGMTAIAAACSGDDETSSTSPSTTPQPSVSPSTSPPTTLSSSVPTEPASTTAVDSGLTPFGAADFESLGACVLLAPTAAGPFPTIDQLDRRDVTEGYPGHPMRLGLRVINAACEPVPGAAVEIWHADASGDYSSYVDSGTGKDEGEGTTFLRGVQTAGDDGIVEFHTIYPGWYRGRAVHIHVRVHVDGREVLTSQLFFDDAYSEAVFEREPYLEFGPQDTSNDRDGLAGPALVTGGLLALNPGATSAGEGTVALTNLGVSA